MLSEKDENVVAEARIVIERQTQHLKVLVDDLLEVSRISSGKININRNVVDLRTLINQAAEGVRMLFNQKGHKINVSMPTPVLVDVDPIRIEQVFVNLFANAAKYTNDNGEIFVTLKPVKDQAVISVRDTGVGIDPDLLPRIFDLFTQDERSLDRSQGGLGIGLTIAKKLVEMHGGKIEAHSTLGRGSQFIVRLPLATEQAPAVVPPSSSADKSLRIMVVDDNVDQVNTTSQILRIQGHEIKQIYSGKEALEQVESFKPNLILLDLGLPGIDGYEVAKRLRQNPLFKGLMLVAVTGYGHASDRQRSKEAGFDYHLVKPVAASEFQKMLWAISQRL